MVTKTLTKPVYTTKCATDTEQYAKIVRVIRNMDFLKLRDNNVVPIRTEAHPSPMKQSASNRQPGQSHTRPTVTTALNHELAMARYLIDDLADHVFGHIVSTGLARDILCQLVNKGVVQVFKGRHNHDGQAEALDADSEDAQRAIENAFEDADMHDCIRPGAESDDEELESSSTDPKGKGNGMDSKNKGKKKERTYSFKWSTFPGEPIDEDKLVIFLNDITDHAFAFAQPKLVDVVPKLKNRFATRSDRNRAMSLSYETDGEDMRPDFVLLPVEAFSDNFRVVDPRYLNFTATRLVGEAKNKDLAAGVEQVERYARGLKRAQPWVHYVLAMTITKDKAVFIRGEGSGTERLELILADGRGCIEFIRILLGLALAEDVDLGHNPDVVLKHEVRTSDVKNTAYHSVASNAPTSATATRATRSIDAELAAVSAPEAISALASDALPVSSRTRSATAASRTLFTSSNSRGSSVRAKLCSMSSHGRAASLGTKAIPGSSRSRNILSSALIQHPVSTSSSSAKRAYSDVGDDARQERRRKKPKTTEPVAMQQERVVFFPLRVYSHSCLGILFTSSSIRGRGTTVFCVIDLSDEKKRLALKMSWQDLERVNDQAEVMERLEGKSHPNVIVPLETFNAERKGQMCTTLGAVRGFLDEQIDLVQVENRVLSISLSELKRPVKYFWGVHDFIRGLRGALLGHEFLTSIGILHRDISENNIVLGVYPWEEKGYLIDLDMAILQDAEKPTSVSRSVSIESEDEFSEDDEESSSSTEAAKPKEKKPVKALRTGTFPYISFNVLLGERHTHFDDVESFLYVLILFFFSYAGPLSKKELMDAHENGFVRPIGCGRLSHMKNWPKVLADWADGDPDAIAGLKSIHIAKSEGSNTLVDYPEVKECLRNNWPEALYRPIRSLLQVTLLAFQKSRKRAPTPGGRTELSHSQFVKILDKWLKKYSELEDQYSNCPDFEDLRNTK